MAVCRFLCVGELNAMHNRDSKCDKTSFSIKSCPSEQIYHERARVCERARSIRIPARKEPFKTQLSVLCKKRMHNTRETRKLQNMVVRTCFWKIEMEIDLPNSMEPA